MRRAPRRIFMLMVLTTSFACASQELIPEAESEEPAGWVRLTPEQMAMTAIETRVVHTEPVRRSVRVPGTVMTPDTARASVGSVVEGRVVRVRVLPGDEVRRGTPLVELHAHEVADAEKDLAAAEARFEYEQRASERADLLYEAGAVSLQEVERRKVDHAEAAAEVNRAKEVMEHLNARPGGISIAVAPRAGTVFKVHVQPGEAILPGAPLVELGSTDVLWVTAFVPENTAATLSPGEKVLVGFRSLPDTSVTATLIRTGVWVDPANRSVEVRFELDEVPDGLRPGSFAVVDVGDAETIEGASLPEGAVVRLGDVDAVFVMEEPGLFRTVEVRAEPLAAGQMLVQGVPEDAAIVVEGAYFVKAALEMVPGEGGHE